jgi:hypothetical protein
LSDSYPSLRQFPPQQRLDLIQGVTGPVRAQDQAGEVTVKLGPGSVGGRCGCRARPGQTRRI